MDGALYQDLSHARNIVRSLANFVTNGLPWNRKFWVYAGYKEDKFIQQTYWCLPCTVNGKVNKTDTVAYNYTVTLIMATLC